MRTGCEYQLTTALLLALASCGSEPGVFDDPIDYRDDGELLEDAGIENEEALDPAKDASDDRVDGGQPMDAPSDEGGGDGGMGGSGGGLADSGPNVDSGDDEDSGTGPAVPSIDEEVGKGCSSSKECESIPGYDGVASFCNEVEACSAFCFEHADCGCPGGTTTDDIAAGACAALCTGDGFPRCHRLCDTDDDCEGRQRCRTWMTEIPFCQ